MLLVKLMSMNSINFDLKECNFSDEANNKSDGLGEGRDGSGRAAIFRMTNLPHCFTMEGHYATGLRLNTLKPRFDLVNKVKIAKETNPVQDITSAMYRGKKSPNFTPDVFKDVGRAFLVSILDFEYVNPVTRIVKSLDESL
jgi:hypothetical protein